MAKRGVGDVPVLDLLKQYKRLGQQVMESATDYIEQLEAIKIAGIECGQFYQTVDGSVVCVVAKHTRCRCPICTGRAMATSFGPFATLFGMMNPKAAGDNEDNEEHEDTSDQPKQWVVSLLRGGHGCEHLAGEKPGERYVVDDAGRPLLDRVERDGDDFLSKLNISMAGLTLKTRLAVSMAPMKPETP